MKIRKSAYSLFRSIYLVLFLFIIAVLYSVSGIFFGLDFTDSFYHLNQALHPVSGTYLFPFFLSSLIIKEIINLVGQEVINIRLVNWILLTSSIFVPFIFYKVNRRKSEILFYCSIITILYVPLNANILGYDTLSIFVLSLLFSLNLLYIRVRKIYLIYLLALLCAAAVLVRLPNVLAVPVIFFFLLGRQGMRKKEWSFKELIRPLTFAILTVIFVLLGYSLYYSSWNRFVAANPISASHDLFLLFSNYFRDAVNLAGYCILVLVGWVGWVGWRGYLKAEISAFPLLKEATLGVYFAFCLFFFVGHSKYSANYSLFSVAVVLTFCLIQIFERRRQNLSDKTLILLLFLLFLSINPFGSNTGLLKAYSLLVLAPFVLTISVIRSKKFWLILIAVLIPFSVFTKVFGIYEDKNLYVLNEKLELEKLSPIYTNNNRAEYLERVDATVQNLKSQGVQVFFYGDKAHIFHYLYPETSIEIISFFQPVDKPDFLEEIDKAIKRHPKVAVFLVSTYPHTSTFTGSLLEQLLISMGCRKVKEDSVTYFFRVPN